MAFGYPPEHGVGLVVVREPFVPAAVVIGMAAVERVLKQGFGVLPDAKVDDDAVVIADADGGRIAVRGLVAPDEARGLIGKLVDCGDVVREVGHHRRIERRDNPGDVVLGEVVRAHAGSVNCLTRPGQCQSPSSD